MNNGVTYLKLTVKIHVFNEKGMQVKRAVIYLTVGMHKIIESLI